MKTYFLALYLLGFHPCLKNEAPAGQPERLMFRVCPVDGRNDRTVLWDAIQADDVFVACRRDQVVAMSIDKADGRAHDSAARAVRCASAILSDPGTKYRLAKKLRSLEGCADERSCVVRDIWGEIMDAEYHAATGPSDSVPRLNDKLERLAREAIEQLLLVRQLDMPGLDLQ